VQFFAVTFIDGYKVYYWRETVLTAMCCDVYNELCYCRVPIAEGPRDAATQLYQNRI